MKAEDKKRALQFLEMIDLEVIDRIDVTHSGSPNMEMKISVWVDQLKAIIERSECDLKEPCPECGAVLIEKWSGVECSRCNHKECY